MSDYDWGKFTRKINIEAPIQSIYDAWTIPLQLERWFVRDAAFKRSNGTLREKMLHLQKGDQYAWLWYSQPDSIVEKGEVLMANETDKLQFSFTGGAVVTVDIGEAFGNHIVMLTQENIPTDEKSKVQYHLDCLAGWTFYLTNLKSYLEGGIDLRNKNIALTNLVNS